MIYPIVVYGNQILKRKAEPVDFGTDLSELAKDMYETLKAAKGIGLAAPQIGKGIRFFIVDGRPLEEEEMQDFVKVFINAEIIEETGKMWDFEEGCLSIPGIRAEVARPERLVIRYYDENWEEKEEIYDGMKARIIQHEYDHIEGILFTDYLTPLKKRMLKKKLLGISKGELKADYRVAFPRKKINRKK